MPWGPHAERTVAIRSASHLKVRFIQQSLWNGEKWVKDVEAENLAKRHKLEGIKQQKLYDATCEIAPLQDAIDLDMATEEEKKRLIVWKRYRVLVNRIETSTTDNIVWPVIPK